LRALLSEAPGLGPNDARDVLNRLVYDGFRMILATKDDFDDTHARWWAAATIARTLPVRVVLDKPGFSRVPLIATMTSTLSGTVQSTVSPHRISRLSNRVRIRSGVRRRSR